MLTKPPYFAVIFTSKHSGKTKGYEEMSIKMETLAKNQSGFIGVDSARDEIGITVSYWKSIEDIKRWKLNSDHLLAQSLGKEKWYSWYSVKICKVEHEYDFTNE